MNRFATRPAYTLRVGLLLIASSLAVGCASIPDDRGFSPVQQLSSERLNKQLHWRRGNADDQQITAQIQAWLAAPIDCDRAVQIALLNNPGLQAQYENLGIAQADLIQAGLLRNPVLDANILFGDSSPSLDLGLSQSFLSILYRPLKKRIAGAELAAAQNAVNNAVFSLAAQTVDACLTEITDRQALNYVEQQLRGREAALFAAQRIAEAGNMPAATVLTYQAQLDQAQLALNQQQLRAAASLEQLTRLLGLESKQALQLPARLPLMPRRELDINAAENRVIKNSLRLQQARAELNAAGHAAGLDDISPILRELELGLAAERTSGEWQQGFSIDIPLPLFDQGQARQEKARALLNQAAQQYRQQYVETASQARQATFQYQQQRQTLLRYLNSRLPNQRQQLQQQRQRYNAMQIGLFELLDEASASNQTQQQWLQALSNYWRSHHRLKLMLAGASPSTAMAIASTPSSTNTEAADH